MFRSSGVRLPQPLLGEPVEGAVGDETASCLAGCDQFFGDRLTRIALLDTDRGPGKVIDRSIDRTCGKRLASVFSYSVGQPGGIQGFDRALAADLDHLGGAMEIEYPAGGARHLDEHIRWVAGALIA